MTDDDRVRVHLDDGRNAEFEMLPTGPRVRIDGGPWLTMVPLDRTALVARVREWLLADAGPWLAALDEEQKP